MTPIAVTILLTEATRTGSSMVTGRLDCGSAMPSAKLAMSLLRSKATPTSAWTGGVGDGTVAHPASARHNTKAGARILPRHREQCSGEAIQQFQRCPGLLRFTRNDE